MKVRQLNYKLLYLSVFEILVTMIKNSKGSFVFNNLIYIIYTNDCVS